ncbi:MAG: hypothetical protein MUF51_05365 [Vicinamibacteria bacterium]|jgi:molybdenum cofactor biosynthesis enzyme MoaA|nr:hypothetical protein [Vicinamibacteria bacterium]
MRIQTFSIVTGSEACNARCPFCISKMTVPHGLSLDEPMVNWRNFHKACRLASQCGVTTAMLTGKGEPTLFPNQITRYLHEMKPFDFPLIELQSNGLALIDRREAYVPHLAEWYHLGLTLIALSIVHHDAARNREVYTPHRDHYIDLPALIDMLHQHGFAVRLACILAGGFIDSPQALDDLIDFARAHRVEQLTVRAVNRPASSRNPEAWTWAEQHGLTSEQEHALREHLDRNGRRLMTLMHGAVIYDVDQQNVGYTHSLTIDPDSEDIRQLIFFPDGHLRYDWQHAGAVLL